MDKDILICYKLENMNAVKKKQFHRKLFGGVEKSHGSMYTTKFNGYLTDKEYEKPVRATIIINKKDLDQVLSIMKEFNARIRVFEINEISP